MRGVSPHRLCLVLAIVLVVAGVSGAVAGQTTAGGGADLTVQPVNDSYSTGPPTGYEVEMTNTAAAGDDQPPEVEAVRTEARFVDVSAVTEEGSNVVVTGSESVGNLSQGESTTAGLTINVLPEASTGEHEVNLLVEYTEVTNVTYTESDGEVTIESVETAERTETVTVTVQVVDEEPGPLSYLLWSFPSLFFLLAVGMWMGGKMSTRIETGLNRVGRVLFGRFVSANDERENRIESAYIDVTYRTYAATSFLFGFLGLVAGAVAGAYIVAGFLVVLEPLVRLLSGLPNTITRPIGITPQFEFGLPRQTFILVSVVGGVIIGAITAVLAYVMRWQLPSSDAEVRRRSIEEGLPRTTAFMYALSRGGMEFPEILRTLADNDEIYGETAKEMSVAVREMDLFGRDMITALRRMSKRTPSEQFKTFSENLTSILQSGSDLSEFLREQYERFREDEKERQEDVLELLAMIAEGYVTVPVAGMLFLITIILIFGLVLVDTLWILELLIYLIMPLLNGGFALFLQQKLDELGIARQSGGSVLDRMRTRTPLNATPRADASRPDGGVARDDENWRMLALYDRVSRLKQWLRSPLRVFLWNPGKLLWIVVPVAVVTGLVRGPAAFQAQSVNVRVLDDIVVQSVLFVLITYGIVRQVYTWRLNRIEAATPELLERLASLNEAGMSIVEGFDRVRGSELGILSPEVERIWRDLEFGSNIDDALIRFGRRMRTRTITRIVVLLTEAMRASSDMGPVLRIAAAQARSEVKLRRQRSQQMFTYLFVIYISFFVFLGIIGAVSEVLVPSLPETVPTPSGDQATRAVGNTDQFTQFGDVNQASYTLVFFHAVLIQGVCAGFIGGQLGSGSLRDGAKHAAIMLTIAYVVVLLLSSPVASLSLLDTASAGESVEIDSATLSDGGFVAVYDERGPERGELLGYSGYLEPGTHSDVVVPLQNGEITETTNVVVVAHQDTNDNEQFDFDPPYQPVTSQTDGPYQSTSDGATPGTDVEVTYSG